MDNIIYRPNVAAILQRADGRILVGERTDVANAWQFPQGGVDKGETLLQALHRELWEELGIKPRTYTAAEPRGPYRYLFTNARLKWGCHGQEQYYFLVTPRDDCEPTVNVKHPEFRAIKWIDPAEFQMSWLPEMKKQVYRDVFRDFFGIAL
ncbi:MAG TPA: NUDIX domain-containing protein [Chthoniobacterales bacterium]